MKLKKRHSVKYGDGRGDSWLILMEVKAEAGEFCRCRSPGDMKTFYQPTHTLLSIDCLKCDRPVNPSHPLWGSYGEPAAPPSAAPLQTFC